MKNINAVGIEPRGRLELIIGPMFAGKTTELLRRVKRYELGGKACCLVKYARDTRYSISKVASHDDRTREAHASVTSLSDLTEALWRSYDVIALDEGQFFPDLLHFCEMAAGQGKTVVVAALDGDFRRKPFGDVCALVPLAEDVTKLSAVCMLCRQAEGFFTKRIGSSTDLEVIGGAEMYVASCRACFDATLPQKAQSDHHTKVSEPAQKRETSPA